MASFTTPDLRVYPDLHALSLAAAEGVARVIRSALSIRERVTLALCGGTTPQTLYKFLAQHSDKLPWERVHVFWTDERYVPPDHEASNYRMVCDHLLSGLSLPQSNIHAMPTNFAAPDDAARSYEKELRCLFPGPWPRFDLVLLGVGEDGHVASLFPNSDLLREGARWVVASEANAEPKQRLSLTLPVLNHAATVFFLVAGHEKAGVVAQVLLANSEALDLPATLVRPSLGPPTWWLDAAAARNLPPDLAFTVYPAVFP
jgi:6-phosphogluconolactonase